MEADEVKNDTLRKRPVPVPVPAPEDDGVYAAMNDTLPRIPPKPSAAGAGASGFALSAEGMYEAMPGEGARPGFTANQQATTSHDSSQAPWLHGSINRKEADALLAPYLTSPGVFLVRSKGAKYAVSVSVGGKTEHHVLDRDPSGLFTVNGRVLTRPCRTLTEVVDYLRDNTDRSLCSASLTTGLSA